MLPDHVDDPTEPRTNFAVSALREARDNSVEWLANRRNDVRHAEAQLAEARVGLLDAEQDLAEIDAALALLTAKD